MSTDKQYSLEETNVQSASNLKENEVSLKQLILKLWNWWKYILSKWLIILAFGLLGGASGLFYSFLQKPLYKAELSFALEDEKGSGGLGGALGLASQFGFDLGGAGGGAFSGDNLLYLIKSRSMVEKALLATVEINGHDLTLAELYIKFNNLREQWNDKPELSGIRFLPGANRSLFSLQQDSILGVFFNKLLISNLSVVKLDKKQIIIVKVISENELFAKLFTEILTKEVSDFYVDTKTKKSVQNLNILQHQTDSVRKSLNFAITGVASSVDANPNANPSRQVLKVPSQRRQVDVQANQAILTELVKNLEISKISLRKETPLIQIIDKPILPLEKDRFGKAKGIIFGGLLGGFLIVLILAAKRVLKKVMT